MVMSLISGLQQPPPPTPVQNDSSPFPCLNDDEDDNNEEPPRRSQNQKKKKQHSKKKNQMKSPTRSRNRTKERPRTIELSSASYQKPPLPASTVYDPTPTKFSSRTSMPAAPHPTSSGTSYFEEVGLDTDVMNTYFISPQEDEEVIMMDEFDDSDSFFSTRFDDGSSREATGTPQPEMNPFCSPTSVVFVPPCPETISEPLYNPLCLGGETSEEQKPKPGDDQEDEGPQEHQRLKRRLAYPGEGHCMVKIDFIQACAMRALKNLDELKRKHNINQSTEEHIRQQDEEPRNLETEAQRAFQSPSAMAVRRLGQRGLLFQNKSIPPSVTGRGGSSDGVTMRITTTIPKRRIQTRRTAPDPTLFLQMNSALQVRVRPKRTPNKASNNAIHGNGEDEREEGNDEELVQKLREEHEERVFQVRVNSRAALHLSCLLPPHVRRYLALSRYRRLRHAACIIQEQYRRYRLIQEQRRIHCEQLRQSAARASRANLKQHREQHDTMTLLERRHVASKVVGRVVLRHYTRNETMRHIAFAREREQAEEWFRRERNDWAATLIAHTWLNYKENCRQRFELSLRLIRQNSAARVIPRAMTDHYLKTVAKQRELEDWVLEQTDQATAIVQRQIEGKFQARHRAAGMIGYAWRRHQSRQCFLRNLSLHVYQRQVAAAMVILRALVRNHARCVLEKRLVVRWAARTILRALSQWRARRVTVRKIAFRKRLVAHRAARTILRALSQWRARRVMVRKIASRKRLVAHRAARTILRALSQWRARRVMVRKIASRKRLVAHRAARTILRALSQWRARRVMVRKIASRKRLVARRAARTILRALSQWKARRVMVRKIALRRLLEDFKRHQIAACVVTRAISCRGFQLTLDRRIANRRYQKEENAALTITRAMYRKVEQQKQHAAAVVITRALACMLERRTVFRNNQYPNNQNPAWNLKPTFSQELLHRVLQMKLKARQEHKRCQHAAMVVTRAFSHVHFQRVLKSRIAIRTYHQEKARLAAIIITRFFSHLHFQGVLERRIAGRKYLEKHGRAETLLLTGSFPGLRAH